MRLVLIGTGLILLTVNACYYIKRRIYEEWTLVWILVAFLEILAGVLLAKWMIIRLFPFAIPLPLAEFLLFLLSARLSVIRRENQELAMQVSLLNQENEMILHRMERLEKHYEEKEDSVCH